MSEDKSSFRTVEIHGTGTHNRGAELMTIAVCQQLRKSNANVRIVVPPRFGNAIERAEYKLLVNDEFPSRNPYDRIWARVATHRSREILGIVKSAEIDTVLDASGFAYSDQWGPNAAKALLKKMNRSYRKNQQLILLPQALGPFENAEVKSACEQLFERSSIVFARDSSSYRYASQICPESKLKLAPDFTLSLKPAGLPSTFSTNQPGKNERVLIVPNLRMTDKLGSSGKQEYLDTLTQLVQIVKDTQHAPAILLHDKDEDRKLLPELFEKTGELPVLEHPNPLVLKAILGQARLVIASRFHALASSLSQAVPSFALGWSHKYELLLNDFNCPEMLLSLSAEQDELKKAITGVLAETTQAELRSRLGVAAASQKAAVEEMWNTVRTQIAFSNQKKSD